MNEKIITFVYRKYNIHICYTENMFFFVDKLNAEKNIDKINVTFEDDILNNEIDYFPMEEKNKITQVFIPFIL